MILFYKSSLNKFEFQEEVVTIFYKCFSQLNQFYGEYYSLYAFLQHGNSVNLGNSGETIEEIATDRSVTTIPLLTSNEMKSTIPASKETVSEMATTSKGATESQAASEAATNSTTQLDVYRDNFTCRVYFEKYCVTFNGRNGQ